MVHKHTPPFQLEAQVTLFQKELTFVGILTAWFRFWHKFPHRVWESHIDSLLVPTFRPEWGKYQNWSSASLLRKKRVSIDEIHFIRNLKKKRRQDLTEASKTCEHVQGCNILTFNVSGVRFQTQVRTVEQFPESLLGNHEKRKRFYDVENDEYFFDRHAPSFEAILHFYQTQGAMLNRPPGIPLHVFEEEMAFYQVDPDILDRLRSEEGFYKEKPKSTPRNLYARKVWLLFEQPESSMQARVVAIISIFVIIVSIFILCLETLDNYKLLDFQLFDPKDSFFLTESAAMLWFIFELVVRFTVCHRKAKFVKDPMNVIDFVAILPYFLQLATEIFESPSSTDDEPRHRQTFTISVLRVIRLVRVLRIFKLSRHSKGLKVLGLTLQASMHELVLLLFFLTVGVVLFSAAVYFAESYSDESQFASIPDGFSWAVTTMTTLGYGDVVPVTVLGKVVGSACAVAGVLTLSLPVPVIVSNFNYFSHRDIDQEDLQKKQAHVRRVDACPYLPECDLERKEKHFLADQDDMYIRAANAPLFGQEVVKTRDKSKATPITE